MNADVDCRGFILRGDISASDVKAIEEITVKLASKRRGGLFELNSKGGDVDAALQIGRLFRKTGTSTIVANGTYCVSACVFLLAGGVSRAVGDSARIGIHRPYRALPGSASRPEIDLLHKRLAASVKQYLKDMNVSERLWDDMVAIPSERVRWLSQEELDGYGLGLLDPVEAEMRNDNEARNLGISIDELLRRKARADALCVPREVSVEEYKLVSKCRDRVLRGL